YAGTDSGVWRRAISEMTSMGVASASQQTASIACYPNPFTQFITVSFASSGRAAIRLSIFNLLGQEVARVFDGELDAGQHSYTWDARRIAPGMYECVMQMGEHVEKTPVMVIR